MLSREQKSETFGQIAASIENTGNFSAVINGLVGVNCLISISWTQTRFSSHLQPCKPMEIVICHLFLSEVEEKIRENTCLCATW